MWLWMASKVSPSHSMAQRARRWNGGQINIKHHAWCTQFLGLESRAFVEVLEEPQLLRACGAAQRPRRDAKPELMIAGLGDVPWEPQLARAHGARQQPGRAAIQERTQECMTEVMAEGGLGGSSNARARGQECMTAVMNEGIAPCGGPGGASIAKGSRRKAATPEGCDSRAINPKRRRNINQLNITIMKETTRHISLIIHI